MHKFHYMAMHYKHTQNTHPCRFNVGLRHPMQGPVDRLQLGVMSHTDPRPHANTVAAMGLPAAGWCVLQLFGVEERVPDDKLPVHTVERSIEHPADRHLGSHLGPIRSHLGPIR